MERVIRALSAVNGRLHVSPLGAETETSAVAVAEEIARTFGLGEVREDLILAALGWGGRNKVFPLETTTGC